MFTALCLIVNDDLPMLHATLMHDRKCVDQVVIVDNGSTDGTQEFCKRFLEPEDVYYRRDKNYVPERGFSESRNLCFELTTAQWLIHSDANCLFGPTVSYDRLRSELERSPTPVVEIRTVGVHFVDRPAHEIELACAQQGDSLGPEEYHRCICRNLPSIRHAGWLHEELRVSGETSWGNAHRANIYRYHFGGSGDNDLRNMRYAYLLRKGIRDPKLAFGTNSWWHQVYYPEHRAAVEALADRYEQHLASGGKP